MHGLGQDEGLERRAALTTASPAVAPDGQVDLRLVPVAATDHGPHAAIGVEGDQRARWIPRPVEHVAVHGVVGHRLQPRVERGLHAKAAAVHRVLAVTVDEEPAHVLDEVLRSLVGQRDLGLSGQRGAGQDVALDRHGLHRRPLPGCDVAGTHHGVERAAPAHRGSVGRDRGVGGLWAANDAREVGRLLQAELADVASEVGLARGLDAVRAAAPVDGVQVALEDLVLAQLALELHRDHRLLELSPDGPLSPHVRVLHVLLGDGGAALHRAAVADVGPRGPGQPDGVDARVAEEVAVLGVDHGPAHDWGHVVEAHEGAVAGAVVEAGQPLPVGVGEERGLVQELLRRRVRQRDLEQDVEGAGHAGAEEDAGEQEQAPVAPQPAATAGATSRCSASARPSSGSGRHAAVVATIPCACRR